jgi:hypothetical protein
MYVHRVPARQRYDAPHEQLRQLGVEAKREGISFKDFWERSVRPGVSPLITTETPAPPTYAVVWPRDSGDRANAITAIRGTEDGWRRAYEEVPPAPRETALAVLFGITVEEAGGIEERTAVPLAA